MSFMGIDIDKLKSLGSVDFYHSYFLFIDGPDPLVSEADHTRELSRLLGRNDVVKTYVFAAGEWPVEKDKEGIGMTLMFIPGMSQEVYARHKLATITGVWPRTRVVWFVEA